MRRRDLCAFVRVSLSRMGADATALKVLAFASSRFRMLWTSDMICFVVSSPKIEWSSFVSSSESCRMLAQRQI